MPHVICCRGRVFDGACKTFTKAFPRRIPPTRTVKAPLTTNLGSVRGSTKTRQMSQMRPYLALFRRAGALAEIL